VPIHKNPYESCITVCTSSPASPSEGVYRRKVYSWQVEYKNEKHPVASNRYFSIYIDF
jgi:hypothetical protein